MDAKENKTKKFIKMPSYPGGNSAFKKFIKDNLVYPKEALEKNIQGHVLLEFEVDDNGNVYNPNVLKGIGAGCDEEALRLVSLLKYDKVKNRGIRVKSKMKTKISFVLAKKNVSSKLTINYAYGSNNPKPNNSYTYSINIKQNSNK